MPTSDQTPVDRPPLAPPADGMTWAWLAWQMRLYGANFIPPLHLRRYSLAEVEARAREEGRAEREAKEAKESAARIAAAPQSIGRALLDGPSSARVQAMPAQKGWRLRVRYLNHLRRCTSFREAAARVGVDESTARRWRAKYPAFGARCDRVVAERQRESADGLRLRAGEPRRRPYFFRGKQAGEHVEHDDRALMFLMKLEDGQRARAEAREERRLEREHQIRLKEMEIAARQEARREAREERIPSDSKIEAATAADEAEEAAREPEMHASAAHEDDYGDGDSPWSFNGVACDGQDIAPLQIKEAQLAEQPVRLAGADDQGSGLPGGPGLACRHDQHP